MTPAEFLLKYLADPLVTVCFGDNYFVARDIQTFKEIDRVDCPFASVVAMELLKNRLPSFE